MRAWKLRWTLKEFTLGNIRKHKKALANPGHFWFALVAKLVPGLWKAPILLKLRNGGQFYVRDFMTLYIYKEIFIDKCYDYPQVNVSNPTIIDIGANTGLFSIRMKQLHPEASIHCFEPLPSNFEQLSSNLSASKFRSVYPNQKGVGASTRSTELFIHKKNIGGHSIIQSEVGTSDSVTIQIISFKDVLQKLQSQKCDLLKLDCEGAEYEILMSLDKESAAVIDKIVFEPSRSLYSLDAVRNHLTSLGFEFEDNDGLCYAFNKASQPSLQTR